MKKTGCLFLFLLVITVVYSQGDRVVEPRQGWHLLDPENDGYWGISLDKAYALLKNREPVPVIVAVIDSGIDTAHEDLRDILWRNEKEINGNGLDDDGNGYTDDVYGWNFCGSKSGENLVRNTYEVARVYHRWKAEFEGRKANKIPADRQFLFSQWKKAAEIIHKEYEDALKQKNGISEMHDAVILSSRIICDHLGVKEFGLRDIQSLSNAPDKRILAAVQLWTDLFSGVDDPEAKNSRFITELNDYVSQLDNKINRKLHEPEDFRGQLTGDSYQDIDDRFYGNNNLATGSGNHGTAVAGIIGAIRNNGTGVDGIAAPVRIMALRAVPGGDEHDKDVALAIRYAVDHGAQIINMSFGKPVSPYKRFVDDAVRYAAARGVLLVHGAGNDAKDITKNIFYPNPVFLDGQTATNFLTVGASGDLSTGGYAAPFSNYSREAVDIFAPGVYIHTTAAGNGYQSSDGTSMSSPVAAGVAALLKAYFPRFTPEEIIRIIRESGKAVPSAVVLPGESDKKVSFSALSSTGKVINAGEAVRLALELEKSN